MARIEYQQGLDSLEAGLQELGVIVLRALRGALNALESQDVELCDEVIAFDDEIDVHYHRIERLVEEVLAQQSPVASDLRRVLAILHDAIHLERIGDQGVTIAKLTKLAAHRDPRSELVEGLVEMGDRAEQMVRVALDSFAGRNLELARTLPELDELIDRTNRQVAEKVLAMAATPGTQEWGPAHDRRLSLHRAHRRQRRRHRRADLLPRHREVRAVHRCVALTFTQEEKPMQETGGETNARKG
jgi:phosphate transport system protein